MSTPSVQKIYRHFLGEYLKYYIIHIINTIIFTAIVISSIIVSVHTVISNNNDRKGNNRNYPFLSLKTL